MAIQYKITSPYYLTKQTSWFLSNYVDRGFISDSSDYELILSSRYNNRPDLLAYDLYGRQSLWWIFSQVNPQIIDPIFDMVSGRTIMIPTPARVSKFFG